MKIAIGRRDLARVALMFAMFVSAALVASVAYGPETRSFEYRVTWALIWAGLVTPLWFVLSRKRASQAAARRGH